MNPPSPNPAPDRLDHLEASVAHLERLCDQLNAVVIEQDRRLTRLQKRLEQLAQHLEGADGDQDRLRTLQEKPPHWAP
ncbi:MAG: SlyX family protein [Verrucomicrobia bacterium]|nr:SlyX family protein [Verrucomicrobiota bacterium]